ncbi:MAG: hypothetical protein IPJ49_29560 [Candidatus Obscuribacter sp.]|nr:hypothetical protein [Candidatus Obscuribacter sp.]
MSRCHQAAIQQVQDEIVIEDLHEAYWRLDRELLTMSQVSINESKAYNFAFAVPMTPSFQLKDQALLTQLS